MSCAGAEDSWFLVIEATILSLSCLREAGTLEVLRLVDVMGDAFLIELLGAD